MFALLAIAASAQSLTLQGSTCPGPMTATLTGVTPNLRIAFVTGTRGGTTVVPPGLPCAGTVLDVGNARFEGAPYASALGSVEIQANVPARMCADDVQALDLTNCTTSPAVQIWGPCQGTLLDPGNGITGCWYTAPAVAMSCWEVCRPHGGFAVADSQHVGNAAGSTFWPGKTSGSDWMSIECSSTDSDTNWGANGAAPDQYWSHQACYTNCACRF